MRFRNPKIGQQLGAQPTPGFRVILLAVIVIDVEIDAVIDVEIDAVIDVEIDAVLDPLPPFTFVAPGLPLCFRNPEQPRPPRSCEVGRVGGR